MFLSEHFQDYEFFCHHCKKTIDIDKNLIIGLEKLRALVGNRPIHINSGYRCAEHNQRIGGVKNSYHIKGMAADITIKGMTSQEIFSCCEQISEFKGIGLYNTFVHVDTRKNLTRWKSNKKADLEK